MYDIKVSIDNISYTSKPIGNEVGQISGRIGRNSEVLRCPVSVMEFVHDVGNYGKTFSPSSFYNGKRNIDNFEQMQMLVLDFDGKISCKEVQERAKKYELPIVFAYETFSSTYDHFYAKYIDERFRVVFFNDMPITDKRAAKITKNMMLTIFPESDKNDNDVSRMYYGGKRLKYFNQVMNTVNLESLNRNMTHYLRDKYGDTNYKKKITEFAKENGIALDKKGFLDIAREEISVENSENTSSNSLTGTSIKAPACNPTDTLTEIPVDNSNTEGEPSATPGNKKLPKPFIVNDKFIIIKGFGNNLSNLQYRINLDGHDGNGGHDENGVIGSSVESKSKRKRTPYRSSVLGKLGDVCQLFKEFEGGKKPSHDEMFGLATNIMQIESGYDRFMEIINNNSYFDDEKHKYPLWAKHLNFIRQRDYHRRNCNTYCPYTDKCIHGKNILDTLKPRFPIKTPGYVEDLASIEKVEKELDKTLDIFLNSKDNILSAICAQTAIGKTRAFIKRMEKLKLIIFAPTNGLKRELHDRAVDEGIDDIIVSPSLHELDLPEDIERKIDKYYSAGKHKSVVPYLKRIIKKDGADCTEDIEKFLKERDMFYKSDCSAVTTHKNYPLLNVKQLRKYDAAIVDEDITLKSVIPNQINIPLSKLEKALKKDIPKELAEKIKTALKRANSKTDRFFELPVVDIDDEGMEGISTAIDIPSFCLATRFFCNKPSDENNLHEDNLSNSIIFYAPQDLKPKIPTVMVSATMNEAICRYVFGDVNFHRCKTAPYKGTLIQYPCYPMSRTFIDKDLGIFKRIKELTGIEDIITFKKYLMGLLYFGNTDGRDIYKGMDLNVAGTPHQPEWMYKLFAYTFGLDFDVDAKLIPNMLVDHNGYRFPFTTYEDKILRNIQFYMIESELEQAVGRARLLRCDCSVHLFSNFPLRQAVMREVYF